MVDLDLHDGNGTREIFAGASTVHTFSVHNDHWGDTEAVASTSIALGGGVGDELYLGTLLKALPPVVESFRPGLVLYLAGCDVASDDGIGNWEITAEAIFARDRFVVISCAARARAWWWCSAAGTVTPRGATQRGSSPGFSPGRRSNPPTTRS